MPYTPPPIVIHEEHVRYTGHAIDITDEKPSVEYVSEHYTMYTAGDGYCEIEPDPDLVGDVFSLAQRALWKAEKLPAFQKARKRKASRALAEKLLPVVEQHFAQAMTRYVNRT